jgi:hypothetical protein
MPKTAAKSPLDAVPSRPDDVAVTIGGLARAAEVGVETIRYYQRRHLLSHKAAPACGDIRAP